MIRHMHNITQDTLKMKRFDSKLEAKKVAQEMNGILPGVEKHPWIVSKPTRTGQFAVMALDANGLLIYVSV